MRIYLTLLILCSLEATGAFAAPKTDVVTLLNGDHFTGEIKEMVRGKLKLKTDTADSVYIQWDKVAKIETRQRLQVEFVDGERQFGSAEPSTESGQLWLKDGEETALLRVALAQVAQIQPIDEGKRLAALDGYLTGGYSFTKANSLQEISLSSGLSSTQERGKWSLDATTAVITQEGSHDTQRYDITGQVRRFLAKRWFSQATLTFESNDELGLNLRTAAGGAYGRYLLQSQDHEWTAYVGANLTHEKEVAAPDRKNVEAVIGTQYALYQYDTPERTLNMQFDILPSLTDSGRIRSAAKLVSRYEIIKDFFFELSIYGTYDNRPGANAKSNSDYGTILSLGYAF